MSLLKRAYVKILLTICLLLTAVTPALATPPTVTIDPTEVTVHTKSVQVTFSNLTPGTHYYIHTKKGNVSKELADFVASGNTHIITVCAAGTGFLTTNLGKCQPFKSDSNYDFTINLDGGSKWQTISGGTIYVEYSVTVGENPCTSTNCKTALGDIPTDPTAFAGKILGIGIGIAGGVALILMVIGSIRVVISRGDPKNVAVGREMIVAAIFGLLFLIFSVLILKFIGAQILPTNPFV